MRKHIARNPMGAKLYNLGAGFEVVVSNRYQAIKGQKIQRKLTEAEKNNRFLIELPRYAAIHILGKSTETDIGNYESQINLLLKAYICNRVGTAFLIRTLAFIAKQAPNSMAQGLIDTMKRNMSYELRKRPVRRCRLPG